MIAYALRRLVASLLLIGLVLTATFFLVHLAPGEPAQLYENPRMSPEARETMRASLGLDRPLLEQYVRWLGAMVRGDWGTSFDQRRPAFDVAIERLPATCLLVFAAVVLEHGVGILLGVASARRPDSIGDRVIGWSSLVAHSLPAFLVALVAIELFAVRMPIFPTQHMASDGAADLPALARLADLLHHLALPAITLAAVRFGAVVRFVRNGMLDVLGQDYIRAARARGVSESRVLLFHALPNTLGPLIQRLGVALPALLSGTLVLEVIFSWPGVGWVAFRAILARDLPVVLATTALSAIFVVVGSLLADLLHAWLDPRVRDA
ncbi:MAG: ABC transporter permease [Acidobacteriota bacterium]